MAATKFSLDEESTNIGEQVEFSIFVCQWGQSQSVRGIKGDSHRVKN